MISAAFAFVVSALIAAISTPMVRSFALRRNLLDTAHSSRKVHGRPVPRLGGVAIVVAFYVPVLALSWVGSSTGRIFYSDRLGAIALLVGAAVIALLGLYDDLRGADARKKFAVQFLVAAGLYGCGFHVDRIATPFGAPVALGWAAAPVTLLWIVGLINAVNLIDGLDGLAGGVSFIALATIAAVSLLRQEPHMMLLSASLAGAVLGFLFYNMNPATIFMGDTGAMFLGCVLAASSLKASQKSSTAVALLIPIVALAIPIADTVLALARRAARGRPLFSADREHIHHRLLAHGLSHKRAVLLLHGVAGCLGVTAVAMSIADHVEARRLLAFFGLLLGLLLGWLGYFDLRQLPAVVRQRRRNLAVRRALRALARELRRAATLDEVWDVLVRAARVLECAELRLGFDLEPQGSRDTRRWTAGRREGVAAVMLSRTLDADGVTVGALTTSWDDGRGEVQRDDEIALDELCGLVASRLRVLGAAARGREPPRIRHTA